MKKITNKEAASYADSKVPFKANNLSAENRGRYYIVYSYGYWPLYAYDMLTQTWYENSCRYSVTTSKHKTQSRPDIPIERFILLAKEQMNDMINKLNQG